MEISIIMPFRNDTKYLERSIDSVLSQSLPPKELILIDDHSDKEQLRIAKKIIASFAKKVEIRLVHNEEMGIASALNLGLSAASSKWLSFLDADDFYDPNRFFEISESLKSKQSTEFVFTDFNFYNEQSQLDVKSDSARPADLEQYSALLSRCHKMNGNTAMKHGHIVRSMSNVLISKSLCKKIGGFRDLGLFLDYDFCLRAMVRTETFWLRKKLLGITHRRDGYSTKNRGDYAIELIQIKSNYLMEKILHAVDA